MLKLELVIYSDETLDDGAKLILENKLHCHGSELMGYQSVMVIMCENELDISKNQSNSGFSWLIMTEIVIVHLDDNPIAAAIVGNWITSEHQQPKLLNVYVKPSHRNMGIGYGLITELLSLGIIDQTTEYNGGNLENHVSQKEYQC